MPKIAIYTDGACFPNPGKGGWGAVFIKDGKTRTYSGSVPDTTNNRMEMLAALKALQALPSRCEVTIYSDSQYLVKGMSSWIHGWKKKAFKGVKNPDLWLALDKAASRHVITWQWVRGHNGDKYNELADQLANQALERNR